MNRDDNSLPAPNNPQVASPSVSTASSTASSKTSSQSSCMSSELAFDDDGNCNSSPEATGMVLVGCPGCLMYVILSEVDQKCPKCKSTVLLHFLP